MRAAVRAAREQERKKAKTAREKALEKAKAGWKADRGKVVEKAREKATEEQKAKHDKMKRLLKAAKKRASDKESAAAESAKRLKRAKTAEAALKERAEEELQAALEEESDDGGVRRRGVGLRGGRVGRPRSQVRQVRCRALAARRTRALQGAAQPPPHPHLVAALASCAAERHQREHLGRDWRAGAGAAMSDAVRSLRSANAR